MASEMTDSSSSMLETSSEAERAAYLLERRAREGGLDPEADRRLFNDLFVLWRFGDAEAGRTCVLVGRDLGEGLDAEEHLRMGFLLLDRDPEAAGAHIAMARRLGANIPLQATLPSQGLEAPRPSAPPRGVFGERISEPTRRQFAPPGGDGAHLSFNLAKVDMPSLDLWVIRDGVLSVDVSGSQIEYYVFDADGDLINDLSSGSSPFVQDTEQHEGTLVLLDDWFSAFNICHFVFDKIPRLELYRDRFPGQALTPIMFADHPYYRAALSDVGAPTMIAPRGARWSVRGEALALLSNHRRGQIIHPAFSAAPWAIDFLQRHFQAKTPVGERRIYVSRADVSTRGLANEAELQACLKARGFEVHTLSGMDFAAQKQLFSTASHIVGVHGAGLTNLVFAPPGARVLEIMHPLAGTFAYWVMAGALGLDYWQFTADDAALVTKPGSTYDGALNARPLRIDIERLESMLDRFAA